ncbi:MAG: hypothetical protein ACRELG_10520 [Gemmataceae bacterium]
MIASLDDAWLWYESARRLARTMQRLGENHWNNLPWDGDLGRDNHLNDLTSIRTKVSGTVCRHP